MKKIISLLVVCIMLVGVVFSLASCGTMLSGKYTADVVFANMTYEFSLNKVTLTVDPIVGNNAVYEGKYVIEGEEGDQKITFTFEDKEAEEYSTTESFSKITKDGEDYIQIGLVTYKKV